MFGHAMREHLKPKRRGDRKVMKLIHQYPDWDLPQGLWSMTQKTYSHTYNMKNLDLKTIEAAIAKFYFPTPEEK